MFELLRNLRYYIQLEELQLIKCSLLPEESFSFVLPEDDMKEWSSLLQSYIENGGISYDDDGVGIYHETSSTCHFEIRVEDVPLWFEVELPRDYPANSKSRPIVLVRGNNNLDRENQEKWQKMVKERIDELYSDPDNLESFVVQNLLTLHLIPLLHESASSLRSLSTKPDPQKIPSPDVDTLTNNPSPTPTSPTSSSELHHALLTSHHLISPTKRRSLQKWATELSLVGFAKVGYPGVIYAEGGQSDIASFVMRIKAMQWKALRVRFEEPFDLRGSMTRLQFRPSNAHVGPGRGEGGDGVEKKRWVELEKVGEVVEIMRLSGRESFVTEMGLGTASSS